MAMVVTIGFSLILAFFGVVSVMIFITALGVLLAIFHNEFITKPAKVSCFIYSGKGHNAVIDFHLGLASAKVRTILGRLVDLSNHLQTVGNQLDSTAIQAKNSAQQQNDELR